MSNPIPDKRKKTRRVKEKKHVTLKERIARDTQRVKDAGNHFKAKFPSKRVPRKRTDRRRPVNVLASVCTTLSLYCGVASIFSSINLEYDQAVLFILVAQIFDTLDGTVARLTNSVSEFGRELDSLCDMVAFGVAPAVLIHTSFLPEGAPLGAATGRINSGLAILFVICGALRLARYNVYQSSQRDYFTGLPIPAAAATIATFIYFARYFQWEHGVWMLGPLTLGMAYLMVSTIRYPKDKLKVFILRPRNAFRALAMSACAIAIFHHAITRSPAIVLFPLCMTYVGFGIVNEIYEYAMRRNRIPGANLVAAPQTGPGVAESESLNKGERL